MDRLDRATRIYERVLRIYPASYRARFGAEMRQNFRDVYRDEARRGRIGAPFWAATLGDTVRSALEQYGSLIRNHAEMKQFFSNNANTGALVWGFALMVPAGLFFVSVIAMQAVAPGLRDAFYASPLRLAFPVALVGLPVLALALNAVPLIAKAAGGHGQVRTFGFPKRYFWSFALIFTAAGWLAFLLGHDAIGCAAHYLPLLQLQDFQQCASTH